MHIKKGQRWHSLTEPELGLGLVLAADHREAVVRYPARDVERRYAIPDAPLARARLSVGQRVRRDGGEGFVIETVVEEGDLLYYEGEGQRLAETDIDAALDVATPENRLRTGQLDEPALFDLRGAALALRHAMLSSPARGFIGGRIQLFEHQLSIARDVCDRHRVRVLLADEVGLGKTIEALLILHRMLLTGRVERALVLVPPALVHQWLAEAYLRFNLILRVVGRDTWADTAPEAGATGEGLDVLATGQLFVCPLAGDIDAALRASEWDLVIVDEAHHLELDSAEFSLVAELAARVDHLVMLSATPDRDGEEAHFRRLALLDPVRFTDLERQRAETRDFSALADTAERLAGDAPLTEADHELLRARLTGADRAPLLASAATDAAARRTLLRRLLDLHGLGRVMFRNVRARIPGFPQRTVQPAVLEGDVARMRREFSADRGYDTRYRLTKIEADPRARWLLSFVDAHPGEKVLVLCTGVAKVEAFAGALESRQRPIARFHEKMSGIERDRQAAWFLANDGPVLLISSAIGAEGRNFQVARHLVFLDLPEPADRLEQWIGRIDRIGQGDEVRLHPLVVRGSPQHRLCRWHDEALSVFTRPWHGSPTIDREFGDDLTAALLADDDAAIDALIERGAARNRQILAELEAGRDRLLELTSFDADAARALAAAIDHAEDSRQLQEFMLGAFEAGGLDLERIGPRSYAARAGDDYLRPFPGFIGQEMAFTFDRAVGLEHPERVLLTWDHPMVRDTVDEILSRESGNASTGAIAGEAQGLWLEALFVVEPTAARELRADRFLPPTPVRAAADATGAPVDPIAAGTTLRPIAAELLENDAIQERIADMVAAARARAEAEVPAITREAVARMRAELDPVVARLEQLAAHESEVARTELAAAQAERETLTAALATARVRLDALRLVVCSG